MLSKPAVDHTAAVISLVAFAVCLAIATVGANAAFAEPLSASSVMEQSTNARQTAATGVFKVSFNANGGKGMMASQAIDRGKSTALKANAFTRPGYEFVGWNTKANGTGKSYKNKAKVKNLAKPGKAIKLYAQWKAKPLSSAAKAAYLLKLGKIQKEANAQGIPPFGGSNKVMYRFLDVDGDGKREMLVESSSQMREISSYVHAAVYKYNAGEVEQVMVDCGWASWMGSFRCYYPKTRTLVTSFYHNSLRNGSMVYHWNGKQFELASSGAKYKKGKVVKLGKDWVTY